MNALGCDVSHWQGEIDFARMKEAGANFVFLKASQAEWTDRRFVVNYQAAKQAGLLVGMYHYLDWTTPADKQARYFAKLIQDYPPDIEPVLDYEERRKAPLQRIAIVAAREFVDIVEENTGRVCMVYTSPGYWHEYGSDAASWAECPLWIAHYRVSKPIVPAPWKDWLFWQYTDRGDGKQYGVSSAQIDLNWYNGTVDELLARYGRPSPEEQNGEPARRAPVMLRAVSRVNIRSGPSTSHAPLGILSSGERIEVIGIKVESAQRVWIRHERGWSAMVYDGLILMQEVS
ncbi:GH25 family lysozyme [Thermanaerothrix daxensis]|uniref:GH25 family lysozyme n=1 Tax=Thermanaerothrix daxensis TaxID=869279 RepID=UPI0006C9095F|nr:GH25 family lysozyme [Thermanaerothrix daxensis]